MTWRLTAVEQKLRNIKRPRKPGGQDLNKIGSLRYQLKLAKKPREKYGTAGPVA